MDKQYLYQKLTSLKEANHPTNAKSAVVEVIADLRQLAKELNESIAIAQDQGDEATADLFISTISSFEKHSWLLEYTQA